MPRSTEISRLIDFRKEHKRDKAGYRQKVYGLLSKIVPIADCIRKNPSLQREFSTHTKSRYTEKDGMLGLLTRIIEYVCCVDQKLAWKRARVILYLRDKKKVVCRDIPDKIAELGGIEKIVRLAGKDDPKSPRPTNISTNRKTRPSSSSDLKRASANSKTSASDVVKSNPASVGNVSSQHSVIVQINKTVTAKGLRKLKPGRRVQIVGVVREPGVLQLAKFKILDSTT